MKLIAGTRRSGKTMEAIKLCKETGATLLVYNQELAKFIRHRYEIDCLSFHSPPQVFIGRTKPVIIDQVDMFLRDYFRADVLAVTADGQAEQLEALNKP